MAWADDAVAAIAPWWTPDHETFIRAIMSMAAEIELYVDDQDDGTPAWSIMLDPDQAPMQGLPFLAQWVGERLPAGIGEAAARQWIKDAPNQWRGTPYSVARAAQRWLTGRRTVQIRERSKLDGTPDPDWIAVATYSQETPDPTLVRGELRKVIPADIMLDYSFVAEESWASVKSAHTTWATVKAAFATWGDVSGAMDGFISWE